MVLIPLKMKRMNLAELTIPSRTRRAGKVLIGKPYFSNPEILFFHVQESIVEKKSRRMFPQINWINLQNICDLGR